MEKTIQEQHRRDTIISLDINLEKFMEIVEPVNFTSKLSRRDVDKKWLESGGIQKMLDKLKDIMIGVEYLRDVKMHNKMEIKKEKLEELLIEAFRTGQKAYQAPSYPMRIWAREKIDSLNAEKASCKVEKDFADKLLKQIAPVFTESKQEANKNG